MATFRRVVLVLAVLALSAGLAVAQTSMTCNATTNSTQARSEGITELMGDILLTCSGGSPVPLGNNIPQTNFVVFTNSTITSRLLTGSVSEAILMIDDPGSNTPTTGYTGTSVPTFGSVQPVNPCPSATSGCTAFAAQAVYVGVNVIYPNSGTLANPIIYNEFYGIVSGNQVTFNGVPILAPNSSSLSRTYRFTNIRVNASQITGGTLPGNIVADVAITGSSSLTINNSALTTGYVQQSLTTSLQNAGDSGGMGSLNLQQCVSFNGGNGSTPAVWANLRYTELFASAFKTRVNTAAASNAAALNTGTLAAPVYSYQAANAQQNIPGFNYLAESGYTPYVGNNVNAYPGAGYTPGLADFGTRIKAVFNNIPSGVSIFVATGALGSSSSGLTTITLLPSATYLYGGGGLVGLSSTTTKPISLVQLAISNGSAQAAWEVLTTSTVTPENVDIPVALLYAANPGNNLPAIGTATVNMGYAPVAADIGGTITSASSSQPIPRFIDTSTAKNFFVINLCTTSLLFPYVTEIAGFDTGLAIANTSTDPFGTTPQVGTCTLYWYGTAAPANTVTAAVPSGTVWAGLTSLLAPGFNGYMIATCNFQYAHGFAFVSDLGARNLAMGYLALILNPPLSGNRGLVPAAEQLIH